MPAPPSSLVDPAIGHLVELAAGTTEEEPGLLPVLARVADPRHRRGVRHQLTVILGLALCAVVAGARSFTAMAEWAAHADEQTLRVLGTGGRVRAPACSGLEVLCPGMWLTRRARTVCGCGHAAVIM